MQKDDKHTLTLRAITLVGVAKLFTLKISTRSTVKAKELEDLAEAVRTENYRLYALQAQSR